MGTSKRGVFPHLSHCVSLHSSHVMKLLNYSQVFVGLVLHLKVLISGFSFNKGAKTKVNSVVSEV